MSIFISICFVTIHMIIALYDFSFYRIPNLLLGALLVLYGLYAPFYLSGEAMVKSLGVFVIIFLFGFGLYALKYIGAGDAKYLAVASLWAGFPKVIHLLFFVGLIGGGVAILYLLLQVYILRLSDVIWAFIQKGETRFTVLRYLWAGSGTGAEIGKREAISPKVVPYGVAIAFGSIIVKFFVH
jgi:prepilin peptidase CpaA